MSPVEESTIGSVYNSFLINILLMGIYTIIYLGTLYIYLSSKASRSLVVISALTALYLLNLEQTAVQWIWLNTFFERAGEPKSAAIAYATTGPSWSYLVTNINAFLVAAIADSLLIWRCYNVWNSSVRVILLPLALLLLEIGTGIANIAKISAARLNPRIYTSGTGLRVQTSLAIFTAFTQTLVTTALILYRIVAVARRTKLLKRTHNTYRDIVDLVVQSSAVYSVVLLIWAISWASTVSDALRHYIEEICFVAAGIAPTVMVARITRVSSKDITRQVRTAHISDLEFRATTRDATLSVPVASMQRSRDSD